MDNHLNDMCRVCLTCSKDMIDLQSKLKVMLEEDVHFVYEALAKVVKKDVIFDAFYPMYICGVCYSFLNLAYQFIVNFEKSEMILKEHFNLGVSGKTESKAPVEIILPDGRFDVKDLVIVEEAEEKPEVFQGFLNNLGTEISAVFVEGKKTSTKIHEPLNHKVTITKIKQTDQRIKMENNSVGSEAVDVKNQCEVCGKIFKKKTYLVRHMQQMHKNPSSTCLCSECGYLAKTPMRLRYHISSKHSARKFQCEFCEKRFISMAHLQTHFISHGTNKTYLCNVCGKSFNYSNSLEYHIRIHTGEKRYECEFCSKKFRVSSALKRHILSHTGMRPHKCRYCYRAFRSTGERNSHEMLHTGYRPFHCIHCNKGFTKNYNLKVHLMNHKGKFRCRMCSKSFILLDYLKIHVKSAHSDFQLEPGEFY